MSDIFERFKLGEIRNGSHERVHICGEQEAKHRKNVIKGKVAIP